MKNNLLNIKKSVQQQAKERNLSQIFNLIAKNEGVARVEIVKTLGLAASTVSTLTDELATKGLILEQGVLSVEQVGKKPVSLKINSFSGFFVCINFKQFELEVSIYDFSLKRIFFKTVKVKGVVDGVFLANIIEENIQYEYKYGKFYGIIFILSAINKKVNLKAELGYELTVDYLEKIKHTYRGTAVLQENSFLLNLFRASVDNKGKNVFYLRLGQECLSCMVPRDNYSLDDLSINNFGNFVIDVGGDDGKFVRLKDYLSISNIVATVNSRMAKEFCFQEVVDAFKAGEKEVVKVIENLSKYLAASLASVVAVENVNKIILSGELALFGERFEAFVKDYLLKFVGLNSGLSLSFIEGDDLVAENGARYLFNVIFNEENIGYYISQ